MVSSPANFHVGPGSFIRFTVTAYDPDGDRIRSLAADLTRMPSNNGAQFVVVPTNTSGVFTWATTEGDGPGVYTITVRVTDNAIPSGMT